MTDKLLIGLSCGSKSLREVLWLDAHDCKGAKDGANPRALAMLDLDLVGNEFICMSQIRDGTARVKGVTFGSSG